MKARHRSLTVLLFVSLLLLVVVSMLGSASVTRAATTTWKTVVNDQFTTDGYLPPHWQRYDNFYSSHPYGSATPNCVSPQQVSVSGGYLHLKMQWKTGTCRTWKPVSFTGWWSAGLTLNPTKVPMSDDGRVTIRWRVVNNGVVSHRIIPMRWPDGASTGGYGEEDLCEGHDNTLCRTFIHYGGTTNKFIFHTYTVNLTQWHTWQFTQLNHNITATRDGQTVWVCNATTTPACNTTTIVPHLRRVVLQQECANMTTNCPAKSAGTEDIQVDWITVENPA